MTVTVEKANNQQLKTAINMMFAGISSDPSSMESLKRSWWQRLMFQHLIGPRMFQGQMDSFVAVKQTGSPDILGFLIFQYSGELAGTFDWALGRSMIDAKPTADELAVLRELLQQGLDWLQEHKSYPYFYFGLLSKSSLDIKQVLEDEGLWLPDYQLVQAVADGPLAENPSLPDDIKITLQIAPDFRNRALELMRLDYTRPEGDSEEDFEDDLSAIAAMHQATLKSAKLYLLEHEDEEVGFVQQHLWKDELRLTYALKPALWGSSLERSLVAALPGQMGPSARRIRLRTFSGLHLSASREIVESLGFKWQGAPWQRWMVSL